MGHTCAHLLWLAARSNQKRALPFSFPSLSFPRRQLQLQRTKPRKHNSNNNNNNSAADDNNAQQRAA